MSPESLSALEQLTRQLSRQAGAGQWDHAADTQAGRRQLLSPGLPAEAAGRLQAVLTEEQSILRRALAAREALVRDHQQWRQQQAAQSRYQAIDDCRDA